PFQRGVSRQPGAHQRAGITWRQGRVVKQVARVWHQNVAGKAAVNGDPEMTRRAADILIANLACCALSATDPGIYGNMTPRFYSHVRSGAFNPAGNFVTKRERKRTPRANIELFFSAERKIAVLHMQVGVADAATFDSDQYLGALWRRQVGYRFAERRSVGRQGLSVHFHALRLYIWAFACGEKTFANATKPSTGISSARDVGSMAASARSAAASTPKVFRLCRSIFRRCPKAASVTRWSESASQASGSCRGVRRTIEDVTLGGGTNAERATSNRILASVRHPASTERRPYAFVPGAATIRSATSRWNIS